MPSARQTAQIVGIGMGVQHRGNVRIWVLDHGCLCAGLGKAAAEDVIRGQTGHDSHGGGAGPCMYIQTTPDFAAAERVSTQEV